MLLDLQAQEHKLISAQRALSSLFVEIQGLPVRLLSIRAFKLARIFSGAELPSHQFLSSGSTHASRAVHLFSRQSIANYQKSCVEGFRSTLVRFGFPKCIPILSLVPHPQEWPNSSLSAMIYFFQQEGFPVHWVTSDAWQSPYALQQEIQGHLSSISSSLAPSHESIAIFGTSFHHFQMNGFAFKDRERFQKLAVFDTGGTKGKTLDVDANTLRKYLLTTYQDWANEISLCSEYGMCELSHQAYSVSSPFDGTFRCMKGLRVYAVNLQSKQLCCHGENGFLVFLDEGNCDSYGAILTEDIGRTVDETTFFLQGRAPDASLKGCSLNVREGFSFALSESLSPKSQLCSDLLELAKKQPNLPTLLDSDLAPSLDEIKQALPMLKDRRTKESERRNIESSPPRRLTIVTSANSPIALAFPLAWAFGFDIETVLIKLPSLRANDPFSAYFKKSCMEFIQKLAEILQPMIIQTSNNLQSDLGKEANESSANPSPILLFGSAETIATFQNQYGERVWGLGNFANSIDVSNLSGPEAHQSLVRNCSAFRGRGCLTPLAAFANQQLNVENLLEALNSALKQRWQQAGVEQWLPFAHQHDVLEIQFRIRALLNSSQNNLSSTHVQQILKTCFYKLECAVLIDLRGFPNSFPFEDLPFDLAGSGLLYILPAWAKEKCKAVLSEHPVFPQLSDAHQGKTWERRFVEMFQKKATPLVVQDRP